VAPSAAATALTTSSPASPALAIGTHVTLDRARILIRKVELESEHTGDATGTTPTTTTTASAAEDGEAPSSDGETEVHVGPYVIDLSGTKLDGGVTLQLDSTVPAGTYDELTFQIHKLTPGQTVADPDFVANGNSVILTLTVDGAPFTFTSDLTAVAEIDGPITVPDGGTANVTVTVDPGKWFTAPDGSWLDPTVAANKGQIELNIKSSIRGFEDDDLDGKPDH
jgi:hypothetical protein